MISDGQPREYETLYGVPVKYLSEIDNAGEAIFVIGVRESIFSNLDSKRVKIYITIY